MNRKLFTLLTIIALSSLGCSRAWYRTSADDEVYGLVGAKQFDPRWDLGDYTIQLDPRSRMYDPNCPDFEPMPPDDPASHSMMHKVDKKNGYPWWHSNGDTPFVDNPTWTAYLPLNEDGVLVLDADDAVVMGRLQSRNYQNELETLYLSALDVSFERFRFDAQFFAGWQAFYTADGPDRNGTGNSSSVFSTGTFPAARGWRMTRLTTTGGEFVVGLANSMVWQFSGPDTQSATTLIDFALAQPLLRAGGRDRVLERLTRSERTLLANVRAMQRYRQGFYVNIITGRDASSGPQRSGGVFGGSGLDGFSGTGGGGFGTVNFGNQNQGGGGGVAGGAGAQQAGGYMGLLQQQQNIRNQEANIASLRTSLAQLQAFFDAGRIDYFQVELARQALFNAQSQLLNAKTAYQNQLDTYKVTLGLTPTLDVIIADPMLDPFNLIDPEVVPLQNEIGTLQQELGDSLLVIGNAATGEGDMLQIAWSPAIAAELEKIKGYVKQAEAVRLELLEKNLARAYADIEHLEVSIPSRKEDMAILKARVLEAAAQASAAKADLNEFTRVVIEPSLFNLDRLDNMPQQLRAQLVELQKRWESFATLHNQYQADLDKLLKDGPTMDGMLLLTELREKVLQAIPNHLNELSASILELSLAQARARTESVSLQRVDLSSDRAIEIASDNRLDWMNARASLVDSWRLIEFNADNLESDLNILFSGDISNTGNNPLALNDTTGRLRAGVQFDSPLTRLSERNVYRQSLIEYQQARRSYYAFEDGVKNGLRQIIRTLDLNKLNFELRRAAVLVAVAQVELTRLRLQEPPQPGVEQTFSNTTARDLVSALSDLLNVQNDFLSVWVNFEVQRRNLDFDLGTMRIDERGVWIDPGNIGPDYNPIVECAEPPIPYDGATESPEEVLLPEADR